MCSSLNRRQKKSPLYMYLMRPQDRDLPPPTGPEGGPPQWLARLECLQKGLQDIQYQIAGPPEDERHSVPFTEAVMADELSVDCRTPAIANMMAQLIL
ncbi:UNVERIFIED_CONTAM: hypothetical protein Sangu_2748200 [Sesamum angustifolium]|uniref:Uncharacterized protein n=1 Tax=Sesamum angustifolium TaxID=2727405 RepID=A0AAW2IW44_9LAMI